jgi:hypothetical protein
MGTALVVSEFRVLNSKLQQVSYPLPRIYDILISINGFTHATSIDLNMDYDVLRITLNAQKLYTIVFFWDKYSHEIAPMRIANSLTILQSKLIN